MFKLEVKKIKMNSTGQIEQRLGINAGGRAQLFLRNEFDRFMTPYVSMDTGTLEGTKVYPSATSIKYVSPYAHYMYKGKVAIGASKPKGVKRSISNIPIKYQGAPKRGAEWDKRMWNDRKNDILKDLQNYIKRGGK